MTYHVSFMHTVFYYKWNTYEPITVLPRGCKIPILLSVLNESLLISTSVNGFLLDAILLMLEHHIPNNDLSLNFVKSFKSKDDLTFFFSIY